MWQGILKGLGGVLSFFYDVIPNYGVAIILLTVAVRIALLPLTLKQTRSMHAMQAIQPQVKALQAKYKGNRQKLNEELMKLYKEHQVNPLGGCLPLVLQLPVFIALYSVLRGDPNQVPKFPSIAHLPTGSDLAASIKAGSANFLGMNLGCSPSTAGRGVTKLPGRGGEVFCGNGWVAAVPFLVLVALMVFTTWYQQRQMTSVSGQQQGQAQMMMKIMPVFLGFISWTIPAGVLVYWVTTNSWQVGQQHFILRAKARAEVEGPRPAPPKPSGAKPGRKQNAGSRKKRRKR